MAKRVAECIIDLLENEQSDIKAYFKRCKTDWRWLVREDIKQEMRKNEKGWARSYRLRLNIYKYYDCHCGLGPYGGARKCYNFKVPRISHSKAESDEDRTRIRDEIDSVRDDPSMLWNSKYSPLAKITCHKLQQLIDYCKSLGFEITVYHDGKDGDLGFYINWSHWVDK